MMKNDVTRSNRCRTILGYGFAVLSALSSASMALLTKFVNDADSYQILFYRWLVQYVALLPVMTRKRAIFKERDMRIYVFLAGRAISGVLSSNGYFLSFSFLTVSDATTILLTSAALVGFFSFIILKEPYGLPDLFLSLLALVGLTFVAQPTFIFHQSAEELSTAPNRPFGILICSGAAVMNALTGVCIRAMGTKVHFSLSLIVYGLFGLAMNVTIFLFTGGFKLPCQTDLLFISLVAFCGLGGVVFMTLAYQRAPAGPASIVQTSSVAFSFLFEYWFFGVSPSIFSVIGSTVIVLSATGLAVLSYRRDSNRAKKTNLETDSIR